MSSIDVQTGMSIAVLSVCILMLIAAISWSLFSVCCDGIACLLCTGLVQACIICVCCIGEYAALYIVANLIGL